LLKVDYFVNQTDEFKVGILPEPKLSESQEAYYSPCMYQTTVMCIPKATSDREMSEYFFEILSYTGQKYIHKAYLENLRTRLDLDTANETMEIIEDYILPGIIYDPGYLDGWSGLLNAVQSESYMDGKNNFTASYAAALEEARLVIAEWNMAWFEYSDRK